MDGSSKLITTPMIPSTCFLKQDYKKKLPFLNLSHITLIDRIADSVIAFNHAFMSVISQ